jgi:hypothetical protein
MTAILASPDMADDDFDVAGPPEPTGPARDHHDRPLLLLPGYTEEIGRVPYTRISTLARALDGGYGLGIWRQRHIARAFARRPDLCDLVAGLDPDDTGALDGYIEEALVRARDDGHATLLASNRGTGFHGAVQRPGAVVGMEPAREALAAELERCRLEVVDREVFVVNDELRAAGTYDLLVRDLDLGSTHVLDIKTGKLRWVSHICQLDGYAGGVRYDWRTDTRSPIHSDLDPALGFIAHVDLVSGKPSITEVHLHTGLAERAAALMAATRADAIRPLVGRTR